MNYLQAFIYKLFISENITFAYNLLALLNLFNDIVSNPSFFRQMRCGETLITMYNCPLEDKFVDVWSRYNYIVYVIEGRKIWHTSNGSYDLRKDVCVFVRKGAYIVEQFLEDRFCFVLFFVPDHFICDVLKSKSAPVHVSGKKYNTIIPIDTSAAIQTFFQSMMHYFNAQREPDPSLLELKFRELILTIADNPVNRELLSYFCSLLQEPQNVSLQRVMEENFCYNLKLEAFAKLSARSLSAFKRDFQRIYQTTPGQWLMEKRLDHAMHIITNLHKTVSEAAFESGFESASHFSRAFRQRFGTSPATLKQQPAV
jgi:AraC family transcriptional regulator, exoenzyme S synthesis regulatory protein ExsA